MTQEPRTPLLPDRWVAMSVYIIFAAGSLLLALVAHTPLFAGVLGLVIAYDYARSSEPTARTHFRYQIRLFWRAVMVFVLAYIPVLVLLRATEWWQGALVGMTPGFARFAETVVYQFYEGVALPAVAAQLYVMVCCARGMTRLCRGEASP